MTRIYRWRLGVAFGAGLLAGVFATAARAQDEEDIDRKPTRCISVNRIDRNVAASSETVVFFIKGGSAYRNDLVQSCQVLTPGETRLVLNYRVESAKITRLCGDSFSVERKPGLECLLGRFVPITLDEAKALIGEPTTAADAGAAADEKPPN